MKCIYCNADIDSTANVCPYCGKPVAQAAQQEQTQMTPVENVATNPVVAPVQANAQPVADVVPAIVQTEVAQPPQSVVPTNSEASVVQPVVTEVPVQPIVPVPAAQVKPVAPVAPVQPVQATPTTTAATTSPARRSARSSA